MSRELKLPRPSCCMCCNAASGALGGFSASEASGARSCTATPTAAKLICLLAPVPSSAVEPGSQKLDPATCNERTGLHNKGIHRQGRDIFDLGVGGVLIKIGNWSSGHGVKRAEDARMHFEE